MQSARLANPFARPLKSTAIALLALGAIACTVGGCGRKKDAESVSKVGPVPQFSFVRQWTQSADISGKNVSLDDIYLSDSHVYVSSSNFKSFVMTRNGGSLTSINDVDATGGVLRSPAVLPDRVIYPTGTTLEVYDMNGLKLRSISFKFPTRSNALAAANMVFVGLDYPQYGRLAAVDVTRDYGSTRWELQTRGGVSARPAFYENILYIGSEDGRLYAVDIDRNPAWPLEGSQFRTSGAIVADVKADDFGVYVASTDSKLYCLDRTTGKTKWQYFASGGLTTAPIVTADSVYQYVKGRGVVAIDKTAGGFNRKARWTVEDSEQFLSADEKYVYLRMKNDRIVAVDKTSGEEKFSSKSRDFDLFASNAKDSTIYAATKGGEVVAIRPVLTPGQVGELVKLDIELESIAAAH